MDLLVDTRLGSVADFLAGEPPVKSSRVTERSVSEADLMTHDDDAETGSEAASLHGTSTSGGPKKKRTRSPTPSSHAKTDSVPAKRSMTNPRRPAANGELRKSTPTSASSASLSRPSTGPVRRSSTTTAPPKAMATSRPRRVTSSSVSNLDGAAQSARRNSTSAGGKGQTSGSAAAANANAKSESSTSRLKAPSTLNRTFARKSSVSGPTSSATPRTSSSGGTTPRPTSTSSSTTNMASTNARRRDSQLQRPSTQAKSRTTPVATSTPQVERNPPSAPSANNKGKAALTITPSKPQPRQSVSSPSSEVRTSSGRSTPANGLREQLASQIEQLSAQTERLALQDEKLAAQATQLSEQESKISTLALETKQKDKEIETTRSQLREAVYSFDIMAIVCQTLDSREQDARGMVGTLSNEMETICASLDASVADLNEVVTQKEMLEKELADEAYNHRADIEELTARHKNNLKSERAKMEEEKSNAINKFIEQHSAEVKTLKIYHAKDLERLRTKYETIIQELKRKHASDLEEISQRDEKHLQELQNQHEKKVSEITHRFEEMKVVLAERVQELSAEGSDLKCRANQHEEFLRRNSDFKIQAALQQFQHLPEENASLKAVLDLRINENADLRRQNTELQGKLAELEEAREKQSQLLRQIENLEAIISLKTENEKQLHDKHQLLLRRFERESKEKKRLSMGYEELLYKLEEHRSTDDLTKTSLSDIPSMTSSAVIMRPRQDTTGSLQRPRPRGLQHDRSKRRTIASSRELDS